MPIAVDADGVRADLLASAGAHAVCVTPAHQFPTGVVLAPRRRQVLLDWASEDRLVVEDDYDAEFRFDRRPVAALAGQARDRVAYLGSCSKTLVPGVRIGWMVLPRPVRDAVEQILRTDPAGPSVLDQRAFAVLVESGGYDRHLRRMRRSYRARRAELVRLLAEAAPTARVMGADAGVHLALDLGNADESSLVERLAADGLQVMALGECRLAAAGGAGILIGYANLSAHHLPRIAEIVASALR